jgi:hypothetical protein
MNITIACRRRLNAATEAHVLSKKDYKGMKTEQKIRDLTLRLIQIIVWFEILWAVVFLVGVVFQWSGLTQQISMAFFGSGFCGLLVLAALTLLNVTANLNLISISQLRRTAEAEVIETKRGSFVSILAVAGGLIAVVVLSLWFAEWRLYKNKASEAETKIESIAESPLIREAVALIEADAQAIELEKVREALSASIQSGARLSIVFPLQVKGIKIYYELTAWWFGKKLKSPKLSDASLPKFVPNETERPKWDKMVDGKIKLFTVPYGTELRTFRRVQGQKSEVILLLDMNRQSQYARDSIGS